MSNPGWIPPAGEPFPVFGQDGKLMGNLTSSWGQPAATFAERWTLPSIGGSATLVGGSDTIRKAAATAGISGGGLPPSATTGTPGAATNATVAGNWFTRAVIVILGFIFVAVGLSQFDRGQMVVKSMLRS